MAKYHCRCGNTFKLSGEDDHERFLITFPKVSEFEILMDENRLNGDDMSTFFVENAYIVYCCDKCERMHVLKEKEKKLYVYNVEEIFSDDENGSSE